MAKEKTWAIVNISLALVIVLLVLHLLNIQISPVGQAAATAEGSICIINWQNEFNPTNDINRCCFEARKQLTCRRNQEVLESGVVDWSCQTGKGGLRILLNNKAYKYCVNQNYW